MQANDTYQESPARAADFVVLAQIAFSQSRATLHPQTARVLNQMGEAYLDKARAAGWDGRGVGGTETHNRPS